METVQLSNSSEDDEDMYLNSVARLKALKKKQPSNEPSNLISDRKNDEEVQEEKEELIIDAPKRIVAEKAATQRASKRNTPKRRTRRRQTRRNLAESDSDLEIVSVEERSASPTNDLSIIENIVDDNPHNSEDENYEIDIKVLWRSKNIHRLNIHRNENFRKIFEYFANLEKVLIDDILITRNDKTIKRNDSPASISLSVLDILEGGIVKKDPASQNDNDEDACIIKVQTTSKKSVTISVKQDENFETLLEKCAQEFDVDKSKIKLYFDGELVAITDTPDSLEIEDEACFDLRLPS